MGLVNGTNCGFVLARPVGDPVGAAQKDADTRALATKSVAPAGAAAITEIGVWFSNASAETTYQLGLYSHHAGTNKPETRLARTGDLTKPLNYTGWKYTAVALPITAATTYWVAVQIDDTPTDTKIDYDNGGGTGGNEATGQTELAEPWGGSETWAAFEFAIYAVYTVAPATGGFLTGNKYRV